MHLAGCVAPPKIGSQELAAQGFPRGWFRGRLKSTGRLVVNTPACAQNVAAWVRKDRTLVMRHMCNPTKRTPEELKGGQTPAGRYDVAEGGGEKFGLHNICWVFVSFYVPIATLPGCSHHFPRKRELGHDPFPGLDSGKTIP